MTIVRACLLAVAGLMLAATAGSQTVLDTSLGLESIDFAELVVRLENEFGTDPFASGEVPGIHTISDLAALYAR